MTFRDASDFISVKDTDGDWLNLCGSWQDVAGFQAPLASLLLLLLLFFFSP